MPVQLTRVSYRYGQFSALSEIDLRIPEGGLTVLCGVTGSGKSTLLRLLAGLAEPTSGEIGYSTGDSAASSSIVFQQPESQFFAGSVIKDVEYGLEQRAVPQPRRGEAASRALERAGLCPEQYGPRSPFLLSGGEKRRVCIAGAIAPLPKLLLLDEPTAGLDPPSARVLLDTIQELKQGGYAIVVATHDLDCFLPLADQVAVMSHGALRYSGPAHGLWTEARVLEDAGLEPPNYIRLSRMLMRRGNLDGELPGSAGELLIRLDKRVPAYRESGAAAEEGQTSPDGLSLPAKAGTMATGDGAAADNGPKSANCQLSATDSGMLTAENGSRMTSIGTRATGGSPLPIVSEEKSATDSGNGPEAAGQERRLTDNHPGRRPISGENRTFVPGVREDREWSPPEAALGTAEAIRRIVPERGGAVLQAGLVLRTLDPRVKWLAMALWSLVILGLKDFLPLALAAMLIAGLLGASGIPGGRAVWFYRPFLPMFLFLWLLSAVSWGNANAGSPSPFHFTPEGALTGGLAVLRLLLLVSLGFLFTETTTGAPLREGLEWAIAPLGRLGVKTRNWSLAVSVTLQFVPWILGRISALRLALASRGNRKRGLASWTPRQISLMAVPLLLQVIGLGDELSTAIEARGYDPTKPRTPWLVLRWRRRDTAALLLVLLLAALLWGMAD